MKKYPGGRGRAPARGPKNARKTLFLKKITTPKGGDHMIWFTTRGKLIYAVVRNELPWQDIEDMKVGTYVTLSAESQSQVFSGNPNIPFLRLYAPVLKKISTDDEDIEFTTVDATDSGHRKGTKENDAKETLFEYINIFQDEMKKKGWYG